MFQCDESPDVHVGGHNADANISNSKIVTALNENYSQHKHDLLVGYKLNMIQLQAKITCYVVTEHLTSDSMRTGTNHTCSNQNCCLKNYPHIVPLLAIAN